VKFVTTKKGDSVAVVARSVEAREDEDETGVEGDVEGAEAGAETSVEVTAEVAAESPEVGQSATIEEEGSES
jgi:DNA gyrase subunit A